MKYKIRYREYRGDYYAHLREPYWEIEVQDFVFKNGVCKYLDQLQRNPNP